jgi:hypothetical protein
MPEKTSVDDVVPGRKTITFDNRSTEAVIAFMQKHDCDQTTAVNCLVRLGGLLEELTAQQARITTTDKDGTQHRHRVVTIIP